MNNRHAAVSILALLMALLPPLAAGYDILSRETLFPHERIVPVIRTLAAVPHPAEGAGGSSRRRFLRAVLNTAEPWDVPIVWEDSSGILSVGMDRLEAAPCLSRLGDMPGEIRTAGMVCGQGHYGRWALKSVSVVTGGLPWNWRWFAWTPLPALAWLAVRNRRRRRQEMQLVQTARALAQGAPLPPIDPETPASDALAVMAVAIREREERLAAQLQTIEQQNQEILQNREKFITQEKIVTLGHLSAGLAHELGNPLSSLIAHIEWLSETEADPARQKHFDMMKAETRRMDELLRRLLQLARGDAPGENPRPLGEAADGAVELLRHQKWCAGVEFRMEIDADSAAAIVRGDARTILLNLLLNAAQAMNGHGTVILKGHREKNMAVLEICDNGPGISEELARVIFEPFFTTKEPGKGTGLGLPVSRMLAQRAGGDLRCVPGHGGGRFVLELPVVSLESGSTEAKKG